jgi:hypothetical protein
MSLYQIVQVRLNLMTAAQAPHDDTPSENSQSAMGSWRSGFGFHRC